MKIIRGRAGTPSENRSNNENFTGTVWGDALSQKGEDPVVNMVFFAPRARTYWHRHEFGQFIVAATGRGLVVTADGRAEVLAVGDIAWVEGGEVHWHGAAGDSVLSHLAASFGETEWLNEVSDDEYATGLVAAHLPG